MLPPLESFRMNSDTFPVLNPSRGTTTPTPQAAPPQEQAVPSAAPKEQGFLGRMKDRLVGAAKGIGEDAIGTAEFIAKGQAQNLKPGTSPWPPPQFSSTDTLKPEIRAGFDKAYSFTEPKGEIQQDWKSGTQLATLLMPFAGGVAARAKTMATNLEKASLMLTPSKSRDLGARLKEVTDFMLSENVTGNPSERFQRVKDIYRATEDRLQTFLTKEASHIKIPRDSYIERLEALKLKFHDARNSLDIERQIDDAITNFKNNYKKDAFIPVNRFNEWKRSVMEDAHNITGLKVSDEVELEIGKIANDMIRTFTKGLKIDGADIEAFNKRYGTIITARKLLRDAEDKDQVRMGGKLLSTILGLGGGGAVGSAVGMASGPLAAGIGATIGGGIGFTAAQRIAPVVAGTAARSRLAQVYDMISGLEPAAKALLAPLFLAPGKVQSPPQKDQESLPAPLLGEKGTQPPPTQEELPSLESFR